MNSKEFISLCQNNDIEEVQITINTSYVATLTAVNENIEKNQIIDVTNYLIKANYNGKTVSINTEYLDESLITILKNSSKYLEIDTKEEFINDEQYLTREELEKRSLNSYQDILLKNNELRLKKYPKTYNITQELSYITNKKEIINSLKTELISVNSYYVFGVEVTAKDDNESVVDANTITAKNIEELNIEEIVVNTLEENILHLNEQEIISGKYKVLFEPKATISLISFLASMLNGESIVNKISLLDNKIDTKVFSEYLNLIEDPTDDKTPSYRPFDDEGTKTYKKNIIENGVLKTYLFDKKTALKDNRESTGNSYSNGIGYRNLFIKPGTKSFEELLKYMNNGIIITDLLVSSGSSSITTGSYTGQAYGFLVENGKIKSAIKNALFDTTLIDMLNNIIDIGNTIEYCNSIIGSPALLIDNINFIGKDK